MLYRIVAKEDVARGLFSEGPLVEVATEAEVLERFSAQIDAGAVLVRQLSERDYRRMRLDHKMSARAERDEEDRRKRSEDAFHRFVVALTGEDN